MTTADREQILDALVAFARRRPGIDPCNYSNLASYRRESRAVTRDLADVITLARAVERHGITAQQILDASQSAYSGRLSIVIDGDHVRIDYRAGQYWPTEYRRAVCAICAAALWAHARTHCMPDPIVGADGDRYYMLRGRRLSAGDWLRAYFRNEFGARVARRWLE